MKTLEQLSHNTFYNMQNYSQLTIDLVEKAEDLYLYEYEADSVEFGALAYEISTILEVIHFNNPSNEELKQRLLEMAETL